MLTPINSTFLGYKNPDRLVNRIKTTRKMSVLHSLSPEIANRFPFNDTNEPTLLTTPTTTATITNTALQFESLDLRDEIGNALESKSILLLDDQENLLIKSEQHFLDQLKIEPNQKVKVVSIFGNTGEGKSYTMNQIFFNGDEVFRTSPSQTSCTMGVWAMYNKMYKTICLDTEGLLGVSKNEHQRTRLLLKILAVSDIIIYRTRAERLHRDMYTFLGGASKAFKEHFCISLQHVLQKNGIDKTLESLGPAVVIFHESRYTETLETSMNLSPEDIIRENFIKLDQNYNSFSSIKYVGQRNTTGVTSFDEIRRVILNELESTQVRSARDPKYIYLILKGLNDKFKSHITETPPHLYLPAFLTCQDKCQSCGAGCTLSLGHKDDGERHFNNNHCKLQHQYQNFVYVCKKCYNNGIKQIVEPSYQSTNEQFWSSIISTVWSGYIIECPTCGKIYQSREYWYGNKDPKDEAVIVEIVHVWPGEKSLFGSTNSAQKVLDSVTSLSNAVGSVGSQPMKKLSDWMTDQIAPKYWRPNHEIIHCYKCKTPFDNNASKHHCRACGEGFCENCSSRTQPVPLKGWLEPVRVCDDCYCNNDNQLQRQQQEQQQQENLQIDPNEVRVRRIGETVINSVSVVKSVLEIPADFLKETARPSYWTPDNECKYCVVCEKQFGARLSLHHCRECGKGVCDACSMSRKPVPLRGWNDPVRVCDHCS